jgi:phytoene dehydrogenase-like protein
MHTIVVGAGLSGLVAGARLAEADHDVTVLESRDEVGGRVRSTHAEGFTFDRGYQVLFTGYPAVKRELDVDALDLGTFVPGATLARPNHRSTLADPLRAPSTLLDSALNRDVTLRDKLNTVRLQRVLGSRDYDDLLDADDRDIETYLTEQGFSQAYLERFVAPFYGGITLDRSLSTAANVFAYTYKALSDGRIGLPADGMGAISKQLTERARAAGARIELNRQVTAVEPNDGAVCVETTGETLSADSAVVATDPATAEELTGIATPDGAKGCVTQHFSLPDHVELRSGNRILLNSADARPNTVSPSSAAQPAYAPDGEQLLVANFIGRQEASDDDLAAEVRAALESWYPTVRFSELKLRHTDRVDFAQFPQPPGFRAGLPAPDAPDGNVVLAGDYTRWCAIQGSMESGRVAATLLSE